MRIGLLAVLASVVIGCTPKDADRAVSSGDADAVADAGDKKPRVAVVTDEHKALAARARAALAAAAGTPAQEYANRLGSERYPEWLAKLSGEKEAVEGELERPFKDIAGQVELLEAGPTWPRPPLAKVPHASGRVVVDGKLDEAAWGSALAYDSMYRFNETKAVDSPSTRWSLLWDEENLYVAYDCVDRDIVSPPRERDDHVYFDDCVEIFLLPEFRFRTYWELVVGPSGSIFDAIQNKNPQQWGMIGDKSATVEGLQVGIQLRGTLNERGDTDRGYTVELAIPFSELPGYSRARAKAGQRLHFMLVRLDRTGEAFACYSYQPLQAWGHNIWNYAEMELVSGE